MSSIVTYKSRQERARTDEVPRDAAADRPRVEGVHRDGHAPLLDAPVELMHEEPDSNEKRVRKFMNRFIQAYTIMYTHAQHRELALAVGLDRLVELLPTQVLEADALRVVGHLCGMSVGDR